VADGLKLDVATAPIVFPDSWEVGLCQQNAFHFAHNHRVWQSGLIGNSSVPELGDCTGSYRFIGQRFCVITMNSHDTSQNSTNLHFSACFRPRIGTLWGLLTSGTLIGTQIDKYG
jgi:hypothetical protein